MARSAVLIAATAILVSFAWLELEEPAAGWAVVGKILGLALLPAVLTAVTRRWWVGVVALLVCALPAAGIAFDVPVTDMRRGERDFFGPVFGQVADGMRDLWETDAPFRPERHLELAGLLLVAVYAVVATISLLVVLGRTLAAGIVLLVGVGVPVTISASYAIGNPLRTGAYILAVLLFLLYATAGQRRPARALGPAAAIGLVVVLVAVGASASSAVSKSGFLSWKTWDLYDRPKDPVGVRYVWSSNYQGIKYPKKETVVLRIKAPKEAFYWRATTLDEYTGVGWRENLRLAPATQAPEIDRALEDPTLPGEAAQARNWTRQVVTVVALADNHLIATAAPIRWRAESQGILQYADSNGILVAPAGLRLDKSYTVWSYVPEVKPDELAKVEADYPAEVDSYLEVVPDVAFPAFGAEGRQQAVERLFAARAGDALLAEYEPLYRKAREVVGQARSPYLAAATVETWLRSQGGFVYEEQPAQPAGATPPLVDFVLRTQEGYCQHYAGAMAVMLRLLGIPARVAVGFTSGEYDDRRNQWEVTDHNAHAWVEVYFPGYGWLSFDPTPGRGNLAGAYSTSSRDFPVGGPTALGVAPDALNAILRQRLAGGRNAEGADGALPAAGAEEGSGGISIAGLVFILLGAALALLLAVKALRRRLRFLSSDPRKVASACRRDLVAYLLDQRIAFPESATLDELGAYLERTYRVDATPFVRAVNDARFGSPDRSADAAARARRELGALEGQLRRRLTTSSRARGALSLRSLTV